MRLPYKSKKTGNARQARYKRGVMAEIVAACALAGRGYKIVARRYKTPVGEIDIIARHKKSYVFVEVKARKTIEEACSAISPGNKKRIRHAAAWWMASENHAEPSCRFSLFAYVDLFNWRYLDNIWQD